MGFFSKAKPAETDQSLKEAYFTASQSQLIRARYKSNRTAMVAGWVLTMMILIGFFSEFLSPYAPTMAGRDKQYENGPPQMPKFWDENGFSVQPFIYGTSRERSIKTNFRWVITVDREDRRYLRFFVEDWQYSYIDFKLNLPGEVFDIDFTALTFNTHLFGVDKGGVHLFGTDASGKDIFARTLRAIFTSLKCGALGVFIAFVLALVIGGISGFYGGWIDSTLQMITAASAVHGSGRVLTARMERRSRILHHFFDTWADRLAHLGTPDSHTLVERKKSGIRPRGRAMRRISKPHYPPPSAAQLHQLHYC